MFQLFYLSVSGTSSDRVTLLRIGGAGEERVEEILPKQYENVYQS